MVLVGVAAAWVVALLIGVVIGKQMADADAYAAEVAARIELAELKALVHEVHQNTAVLDRLLQAINRRIHDKQG